MKRRGDGMDLGTALIIILIIGAIVALLAALALIYGKVTDITTSKYERRLASEQAYDVALINAAKVLVVGKMAFIAVGVGRDNKIIYDERPIDDTGTPVNGSVIDGKKVTQHQLASKLVDDSITANGPSEVKLLTSRQWEKMGNHPDLHHDALEYLYKIDLIKIKNGGKDQGTYTKDGDTLQSLMHVLAAYAIPLVTGEKIKRA